MDENATFLGGYHHDKGEEKDVSKMSENEAVQKA